MLAQLHEKYPDDVRLAYRHFPLSGHPLSRLATQAAEAAGRQGKFFEMKSYIFSNQNTWNQLDEDAFKSWLQTAAEKLGLDVDQFTADMFAQDTLDKVEAAYQSALKSGIQGTPFLFINGQVYFGQKSLPALESYVKLIKIQYKECPPFSINPAGQYVATLKTTRGDVAIQLFPARAPVTVNNFIFLARDGWYRENVFTVQEGAAVFSGDPTQTGLGNPGFFYDLEGNDLKFDKPGVVGLFNQGPNSGGSIFFITLKEIPDINGVFTIFGQVVNGQDVLNRMTNADILKDVIIEEK